MKAIPSEKTLAIKNKRTKWKHIVKELRLASITPHRHDMALWFQGWLVCSKQEICSSAYMGSFWEASIHISPC